MYHLQKHYIRRASDIVVLYGFLWAMWSQSL